MSAADNRRYAVQSAAFLAALLDSRHFPRINPHDKTVFTYVLFDRSQQRAKIGHSSTPANRPFALQTGNSNKLELIRAWCGNFEAYLHWYFSEDKILNEWFAITPELERLCTCEDTRAVQQFFAKGHDGVPTEGGDFVCPICGGDYVHLHNIVQDNEHESLILEFWTECGHAFTVQWCFHGGQCRVHTHPSSTIVVKDGRYCLPSLCR